MHNLHYVIAMLCGAAILGYIYEAVPLNEITGLKDFGPIFAVIGLYLISKLFLLTPEPAKSEEKHRPAAISEEQS